MSMMAGWMAIVLVLFATVISIVPGAISVAGLVISMLAVVVSLFSIKKHGRKYFGATISLALVGIFLVNDGLRIWSSLPLPINIKIGLYGVALLVLAVCSLAAYRLGSAQGDPNKSVNSDRPSAGRLP
jgi:hypothetical protein